MNTVNENSAEPSGNGQAEPLKVLALIDGANFMFRAYHAMKAMMHQRDAAREVKEGETPPEPSKGFTAPDGTPTGALATFANMVSKAKAMAGADALAIVFESTTGNFRDGLFADYKANRVQTPDEVKIQMNLARDIFPLMGVPVIWSDGFEADDVLCAYAANPGEGWKVAMCSSDKDLAQSIGPQAVQIDPNGWKLLDAAGVVEKFGVSPALVPEYLALMGDGVDNIPGVDKVGHKTAGKLLNQHGSIDAIYQHLDQLTPAIKKGFEDARDRIPQLLQLTRADLNAPKSMTPDEIYAANRNPDWAAALEKLRPLAMGKLIVKAEKGLAAVEAKARRSAAPK